MRKFVSLCISFALLISIFDIIDVNDITLNGKEIFTTDNTCAQHDNDDLSDSGVHLTAVNLLVFNLPLPVTYTAAQTKPEKPICAYICPDFPKLSFSLCRPPIV